MFKKKNEPKRKGSRSSLYRLHGVEQSPPSAEFGDYATPMDGPLEHRFVPGLQLLQEIQPETVNQRGRVVHGMERVRDKIESNK